MPSPKDGNAPSPVDPAAPKEATEADKADFGEVEKVKAQGRSTGEGKYGSLKEQPSKNKPSDTGPKKNSWIE